MARIVYLAPHQDDEVLTYGPSILADVAAGHDVLVVLVTRGEASGARTSPTLADRLGYTPTREQFSAARDREFIECVTYRLGATPVVASYALREPDGGSDLARVAALVRSMVPSGADLVCGIAQSDPHRDHRNTGLAAVQLVAEGWAQSVRLHLPYYNRHLHVAPPLLTRGVPVTTWHQEPYRRVDVPNGFWGVGYVSVPELLDGQLTDPASYFFLPVPPVPVARVLRTGMGEPVRSSDGTVLTFRLATPPATYDASVYQ